MIDVMIFGASKAGEFALEAIKDEDVNVIAFIDNDDKKVGDKYYDKMIIHPSEIKNNVYDYILVGGTYYNEIKEQLVGIGVSKKRFVDFTLRTPERGTSIFSALKQKKEYSKKKYKEVFKESHMDLIKDNYSLLNILISAII